MQKDSFAPIDTPIQALVTPQRSSHHSRQLRSSLRDERWGVKLTYVRTRVIGGTRVYVRPDFPATHFNLASLFSHPPSIARYLACLLVPKAI